MYGDANTTNQAAGTGTTAKKPLISKEQGKAIGESIFGLIFKPSAQSDTIPTPVYMAPEPAPTASWVMPVSIIGGVALLGAVFWVATRPPQGAGRR